MGKVYIVGAGPGDPDLITIKASKCIQNADVIFYDRLVNSELLTLAKKETELVYCGKSPNKHFMKQETIHHLLVKYARQEKNVVRLKGGDPYVFGRGAEEAIALASNGIEYEVIPGVTAGLAVPLNVDIPVTYRETSRSFAMVTGHSITGEPTEVDWKGLARSVDTLAIYMGMRNLSFIIYQLLKAGKKSTTPIAIIQNGTTTHEVVIVGTLATIEKQVVSKHVRNPAIIIIGDVVNIREQLLQLKAMNQYNESQAIEA